VPPTPGEFRANPYDVLWDVLQQQPSVDRVRYRPSVAEKRYLEARVVPERLDCEAGPEAPTVTVRWRRSPPYDEYRVDYTDPDVGFHGGWHRDDDHPEHGPVHFQWEHTGREGPAYEAATVDARTPPRILWELLDRLFERVLPERVAPLYETER
jgi:hypothetical protein